MAYRGYSDSDGIPDEIGIKRDMDTIVNFLMNPPKEMSSLIN